MNVSFSVAIDNRFAWFGNIVKLGVALDLMTRGPLTVIAATVNDQSWINIWQIMLYSSLAAIGFTQIVILVISGCRQEPINRTNPLLQLANAKALMTEFISNIAQNVASDVAHDVAHDMALQV